MSSIRTLAGRAACALALGVSGPAAALEYSFDLFGERIDSRMAYFDARFCTVLASK